MKKIIFVLTCFTLQGLCAVQEDVHAAVQPDRPSETIIVDAVPMTLAGDIIRSAMITAVPVSSLNQHMIPTFFAAGLLRNIAPTIAPTQATQDHALVVVPGN